MPGPEVPKDFTSIIKNGFPEQHLRGLYRSGLELTGVTGPFADRVAGLKVEGGLVREIAVKQGRLQTGDKFNGGTALYRPVMYAMPLNVSTGWESLSLLMIPTSDSFATRIVAPVDDDEANVRGFTTMLLPNDSGTPYIHNGWEIGIGEDVASSFDMNVSSFPVRVIPILGTNNEQLVAQAEAESRELKAERQDEIRGSL